MVAQRADTDGVPNGDDLEDAVGIDIYEAARHAGIEFAADDETWSFFTVARRRGVSDDELRELFTKATRRRFPDHIVDDT